MLKRNRTDAIFRMFNVTTNFKLKIHVIRKYLGLNIYSMKLSAVLPNLVNSPSKQQEKVYFIICVHTAAAKNVIKKRTVSTLL
jgi:hypothetical protein